MAAADQMEKRTQRILFLGPGGSGKSTIFKQLQWIHGEAFTKDEVMYMREHIFAQITKQMKVVIQYYDLFENEITDPLLQHAVHTVINHMNTRIFPLELADAIQYIYDNEYRINGAFRDAELSKYQLLDETTQYFWADIDRIKEANFIPTERDIIHVRARTIGMIEKYFHIQGAHFSIMDVGGQKCERRKWLNYFVDVKAVIFVVSLSCFNERMYEDMNKNAMIDSMELFDETINNKYFKETHIILFLNKKDLFQKKIRNLPITTCPAFDDFKHWKQRKVLESDPNDYHQTAKYVRYKFEGLNRNEYRQIYTHLTYAMDRNNVEKVFIDVLDIVIGQSLNRIAL